MLSKLELRYSWSVYRFCLSRVTSIKYNGMRYNSCIVLVCRSCINPLGTALATSLNLRSVAPWQLKVKAT
jgi:hypothetical protein